MLQLTNNTGFPGMLFTCPDPEGIDSVYAIVKGTFTIGDRVTVAEEQARQKGQEAAIFSVPAASSSSVRSRLIRLPSVSSLKS